MYVGINYVSSCYLFIFQKKYQLNLLYMEAKLKSSQQDVTLKNGDVLRNSDGGVLLLKKVDEHQQPLFGKVEFEAHRYPDFDEFWSYENGFIVFSQGSRIGVCNLELKIIVEPEYSSVKVYPQLFVAKDFFWFRNNILDLNGNFLLESDDYAVYKDCFRSQNVHNQAKLYQFDGKELKKIKGYTLVGVLHKPLVLLSYQEKYRLYDLDADDFIGEEYCIANGCHDTKSSGVVILENGSKPGAALAVNSSTQMFACQVVERCVWIEYEKLRLLQKNGKWGLYSDYLIEYIAPEFDKIIVEVLSTEISQEAIRYSGRTYVRVIKDGKEGVYSLTGKLLVPAEYDSIRTYKDLFFVRKDNKIGLYDDNGRLILPAQYYEVTIKRDYKPYNIIADGQEIIVKY